MNYETLYNTIQNYSQNSEGSFVDSIPTFVQEVEQRVYTAVAFPSLRKNVTGVINNGVPYLSAPPDYLSTYSLACIDSTGNYSYLLNKDVNFIRQAYPTVSATGQPEYYALFGPTVSGGTVSTNLSFLLGPTPDATYTAELHYFYYPTSIIQGQITAITITSSGNQLYSPGLYTNVPLSYVGSGSGSAGYGDILVTGLSPAQTITFTLQNGGNFYSVGDVLTVASSYLGGPGAGLTMTVSTINNSTGTSWLGNNFDPVLLYGCMREAVIYMKGEQDMVKYYEDKYQEALQLAIKLGNGLERGDAYRDGQTKLNINLKGNVVS